MEKIKMNKLRLAFRAALFAAITLALASLGHAQANRTWVSGVGDDANPCSRTAPCKTFAGAISKTAEGGEIDALDPGGYGAVTIMKSITIDGGTGAGWASLLAAGTNGINVNIATSGINHPNDAVVILRHLSINGTNLGAAAPGLTGINYLRAAKLYVEDCTIFGFSTAGISINIASGAGNGFLGVERTTCENATKGITMTIAGGTLNASIDSCVLKDNSNSGLEV